MNKLKIALVSYINTIPFIEAIKSSEALKDSLELVIDYPAKCAELIKNKEVDGGLIPVGALSDIKGYQNITDFCIGADGKVDTVVLFSNQEFNEIETIYLDYQSRTSVRLVKILAEKHWKKKFKYLPTVDGFEESIPKNAAILMIGDRVFKYQHNYKNKIDLAECWKSYTNLPFVFAVWVGNEKLKQIEQDLNKAFESQIHSISNCYSSLLTIDKNTFVDYLTNKIDYRFNDKKKEALKLFTSLLESS